MNDQPSPVNGSEPPLPVGVPPSAPTSQPWYRGLVRCNPFYLISALLLIYGIYRISIDPQFLRTETHQVVFNFTAIEIYEAMLAATALMLIRRKIEYDSMLLFWIENLLVLIPFMLVSHAAFLEQPL